MEFDAAVGDTTIVTRRTEAVDFSLPYQASGLVVVVPVRKFSRNAWAFMEPFASDMWFGTVGFLLIMTLVIWILERSVNDAFRGHPKRQVTTLLSLSFSTLFFKNREKIVSSLGRLHLLIWLFVVMIIFQGYPVGSFMGNYLNEELNIPKSRLRPLNSSEDYAEALNDGRVAAVVHEQPYLDPLLSKYCNFVQAGGQFSRTDWGFMSAEGEWEICGQNCEFGWVQIAELVMKLYTEPTDGSYIETKENALVWHFRDVDPGFGSCQSKEMLDHLEYVLANEPVAVKSEQYIVEVKPQVLKPKHQQFLNIWRD